MRISVRLDDETRQLVRNAAQKKGISQSELVRRAIHHLSELDEAARAARRAAKRAPRA